MLITVVRKSSAARKNRKRVVTFATTRQLQAILGRCRHVRRYGFAPCPYHGRNTRLGEEARRKGWRRERKHTTFINFQKVLNTKEKSERRFYIFLRLLDLTTHLYQICATIIWNKGERSYLFFLSRPYQVPVRFWPVSPWRCCLSRFGPGRSPNRGAAWDSHRTFGGGSVRPASSPLPSCNSLKQLERNRSVQQGRFQSSGYGWPYLGARNPTKFEVILWTSLCSSFIDIFESVLSSVEATIRVYLKSYLDLIIYRKLGTREQRQT